METLQKILEKEQKQICLDIGTGGGNYIHFIHSLYDGYQKYIGIDTMSRAVEMAQKQAPSDKVEFQVMDANQMTFEDNTFDLISLSNSLHHLSNPNQTLLEMHRVLKNDGFILINEMINEDLTNKQKSHMLLHHFSAKIDRLNGDIHNDTYSRNQIEEILLENNLFEIEVAYDLQVPTKTENTEEELNYIYNILDRLLQRAKQEYKKDLQTEANTIKTYIEENGYDGCTSYVVILRKK